MSQAAPEARAAAGGGALQMPAGLVLLSPWVDMACERESHDTNAQWVSRPVSDRAPTLAFQTIAYDTWCSMGTVDSRHCTQQLCRRGEEGCAWASGAASMASAC